MASLADFTGQTIYSGAERGTPEETMIVVFAEGVQPFDDMPDSTGIVAVDMRVVITEAFEETRTSLDTLERATSIALQDVAAIQTYANVPIGTDTRTVKNFRVYDTIFSGSPSDQDDDKWITEILIQFIVGDHD